MIMKLKFLLKTYYPALLTLIILTAFSIFAFHEVHQAVSIRRAKLFQMRVQQATETIGNRMQDYIQILKGCQSVFYATDSVRERDWKAYTDNLNVSLNYPGFQAIAYAVHIKKNQWAALENTIRKNGHAQFAIRSTFKDEYLTPIIFIEPFNMRNLRAFGYDMYSETNRRRAMDRAIVTGQASMTRKVTLIQETGDNNQPGFLLYLPVYRNPEEIRTVDDRINNIKGFVYNAFRAHDLMAAMLKPFDDIDVKVFDGAVHSKKNLLYDSGARAPNEKKYNEGDFEFKADTSINIAGQQWNLHITSHKNFGSLIERRQPGIVLMFGLAITVLLFILAVSIIKRKSEVLEELNLSKELEHKKDEFIGIASHELKTPLTSIKAYMQMLERAELKDKEKSLLQKANDQIKKLNKLIGDLLDVSKIQAGKLQINAAPFLLGDLLNDSIENVQHIYSSHEIVKSANVPVVTLIGDKFRLEQAITNLLINAVKYSPRANKVYVDAVLLKDRVSIKVCDEGIGIPEKYQKQIFDKFYRAEELSPSMSGLGMGLYIANEIIKQHHGELSVKSEVGKGSIFAIELPLNH